MKKWEYAMRVDYIKSDACSLWNKSNTNDEGKTSYDQIKDMGKNGWEMINVTPIVDTNTPGGLTYTNSLLFTFKREIEG